MKVVIITSAYNESEGIESFIKQINNNILKFNEHKFDIEFELLIANNKSSDDTLDKLIKLKKRYSYLRVLNNKENFGVDISILNAMSFVKADYYIFLCSDLEDPPEIAFNMLLRLFRKNNLDSIFAVKKDRTPNLLNFFRTIYYLTTSFSTRTSVKHGFHGFGVYSQSTIKRALIYANKVAPNFRRSILWASINNETISYVKNKRSGGKSSYSPIGYLLEGVEHLLNSPALSSRLSIRLALLSILLTILLGMFFIINFFLNLMVFPQGITTLAMLILITSAINYLLIALNARQTENLLMPSILQMAETEEM